MNQKTITCITCPAGCRLKVRHKGGKILGVSQNKCKKGIDFARKEILNPTRILTTTIGIQSKQVKRLAVRTRTAAPKHRIAEMVREVKKIKVAAPVRMGQVLVEDLLGTGADIIASSTVEK